MLVCYLDDSGKDPQNRVTTLAGYVADSDEWKLFEERVEPVFAEYAVPVLHAKDLHHTHGCFKNWKVIKKQSFTYKICREMTPHVPLGVSMAVVKQEYPNKKTMKSPAGKRIPTPYAFCFNVILDWILRDIRVGRAANTEGLSFVIESGHEHNPDAERSFHEIRKQHGLEDVLRSISFVSKTHCRAIQMADLLAFYTRRQGVAMEEAP